MHQNPAIFKVSTEYGTYHICGECWAAHPIPLKFLKSNHLEESDGRQCQCEHASHFVKVDIGPFNPDGGEL